MSAPSPQNPNPCKWRFTWETLGHIPTLRLFLFDLDVRPSIQCKNLRSSLDFEQSLLVVSWIEEIDGDQSGNRTMDFVLRVPVPRVLIDPASPVDSKANEDHIEVKIPLLLPVDHPLVLAGLESVVDLVEEDDSGSEKRVLDELLPLTLDYDTKSLSSSGGVHFYCKGCSAKLTKKPLRSFVEMPSMNWREAADNWFGTCCCSFGGISEKLVSEYVSSFVCAEGVCLLDATSVIICMDDLVGCKFPNCSNGNGGHNHEFDLVGEDDLTDPEIDSQSHGGRSNISVNESEGIVSVCDSSSSSSLMEERSGLQNPSFCMSLVVPNCSENVRQGTVHCLMENNNVAHLSLSKTCANHANFLEHDRKLSSENVEKCFGGSPPHGFSVKGCCCEAEINCKLSCADERSPLGATMLSARGAKFQANQKQLHPGVIGSGFLVKSGNLSNEIEWIEFLCSQCSSLLGSYPYVKDGHTLVDGGICLFKCCISTSLPVGGPGDIFRKHTVQRVFMNQLLESASDELSFRTLVRDLQSKHPMLQIVVLNSKAWCCTGYCVDTANGAGPVSKIYLHPIVKVLYSDLSNATKTESRKIEEWVAKHHADEVFMMQCQIKDLIGALKSAWKGLPPSCSFLQGLSVSSMER